MLYLHLENIGRPKRFTLRFTVLFLAVKRMNGEMDVSLVLHLHSWSGPPIGTFYIHDDHLQKGNCDPPNWPNNS